MSVEFKPSAIKDNRPMDYVVRFAFGGLITAIAGWTATHYGPSIAGLLLAFPAIFPASATLVEEHERREKREKIGRPGIKRGRDAAAVDAEGAALGCVGLIVFALMMWKVLPSHSSTITLLGATAAWFVIALGCWWVRRKT